MRKCPLVINPDKSKTSEAKGGMTPLEADGWHQERPWRARGVFCLTICGFSTKSQPEILLVSSNKPALTLPTMWMVSSIFFSPFDLTPPGHIEGRRGRNRSAKDAEMVIGDRTNPSQSGEPKHTHWSNIGSQGVQPQLIHRSNTGSVRGSTPTRSSVQHWISQGINPNT